MSRKNITEDVKGIAVVRGDIAVAFTRYRDKSSSDPLTFNVFDTSKEQPLRLCKSDFVHYCLTRRDSEVLRQEFLTSLMDIIYPIYQAGGLFSQICESLSVDSVFPPNPQPSIEDFLFSDEITETFSAGSVDSGAPPLKSTDTEKQQYVGNRIKSYRPQAVPAGKAQEASAGEHPNPPTTEMRYVLPCLWYRRQQARPYSR